MDPLDLSDRESPKHIDMLSKSSSYKDRRGLHHIPDIIIPCTQSWDPDTMCTSPLIEKYICVHPVIHHLDIHGP